MTDFHHFAAAVHQQYDAMAKHELFTTDSDADVFAAYLAAFPPGSNPVFRTNTEHDCSCCKNFVRNLGTVVSLATGKVETVWDIPTVGYPYDDVAKAMAAHVRSRALKSIYRTKERQYGAEFSRETLPDGSTRRWNHFHGKVADKHFSATPEAVRGEYDAKLQVFRRGLTELKLDVLDDILELIDTKALYRGEEHERAVRNFRTTLMAYNAVQDEGQRVIFQTVNATTPAAQFRNTVIGTLAQDLSSGKPMDAAVKMFEDKVAPHNYKRPTALITPRMVDDAMKTIRELDLEPALSRRPARMGDVSINAVLWVSRDARSAMKDSLDELLMSAARHTKKSAPPTTGIHINEFIHDVLPGATGLSVMAKHRHLGNLMTLTAPVHEGTNSELFKWGNDFAWSYAGDVTDSIRERVKKAGGNVNAKLRFSLSWFNHDDLDFHVKCPDGHICFMNKRGILDVDMNAGGGTTREPVENLAFTAPRDGTYDVWVNQYRRRETADPGFVVEIADANGVTQMSWDKSVADNTNVTVGRFIVVDGVITDVKYGDGLVGGGVPQTKWGVTTEKLTEVSALMLSPNCWGDHDVGNKHWFFILKGCAADEPVRGVYNEFLHPRLEKHRKVFEVLGNKTKCQPTADQLSGLGFSSTRGDTVDVAVTSATGTRNYTLTF